MKTIKTFTSAFAASLLLMSSCSDWTTPEHLDYRQKGPQEENPQAYEEYLSGLRQFKQGEHPLMVVGMEAGEQNPFSQSQHLMAMPDSADFIVVVMTGETINSVAAAEIREVKEKKGTGSLLFIDYDIIQAAWNLLEDKRLEEGKPAGTAEEAESFFKKETSKQLSKCTEYGFSGLYISYFTAPKGDAVLEAAQKGYTGTITEYAQSRDLVLIFRGSARNIHDTGLLDMCDYFSLVAEEEKKLSVLPGRYLGNNSPYKDKIMVELTVPSSDAPEQAGASPAEGAVWLLENLNNKSFTPKGLCVLNAHDDYYCKDMAFKNVREAIAILNAEAENE